jgi:HD-like signal output (HDOD) protein
MRHELNLAPAAQPMKRVLFVDDEPQILDGLRNILRKQRKHWDMVFAIGGQAALHELEQKPFDVVVSDMRMPGIDGVTLLQKVKDKYPGAVRIILSGHAEREAIVSALPVVHQFLSKPCDAETLRSVVERACGLQTLLQSDKLRNVIGNVESLPSVPRAYWDITQAAAKSDASVADIAKIVERDPALTAKVLQLVNSSYFGSGEPQTSVLQSLTHLGIDLIRALSLTAGVFVSVADPAVAGFSLDDLQNHSMLTARIARRLLSDEKRAAEAFTAAILHNIGKIVLAIGLPERYAEVLSCSAATGRPNEVVERELLGVTHSEVGAYLLGLWGLPLSIVEAVAYHHQPELIAPTDTLVALHVADALSYGPEESTTGSPGVVRLNVAYIENSRFGAELPRWRVLAEEERRAWNSAPSGIEARDRAAIT